MSDKSKKQAAAANVIPMPAPRARRSRAKSGEEKATPAKPKPTRAPRRKPAAKAEPEQAAPTEAPVAEQATATEAPAAEQATVVDAPAAEPLGNGWKALGYLSKLPGWHRARISEEALRVGTGLMEESPEQLQARRERVTKALADGPLRDRVREWYHRNKEHAARLVALQEVDPTPQPRWWVSLMPPKALEELKKLKAEQITSLQRKDGSLKHEKVIADAKQHLRKRDPIGKLELAMGEFVVAKGAAAAELLAVTREEALRSRLAELEAAPPAQEAAREGDRRKPLTIDGFDKSYWDSFGDLRAAQVVNFATPLTERFRQSDPKAVRALADSVGSPLEGIDLEAAKRVGDTQAKLHEFWNELQEKRNSGSSVIARQVDEQLEEVKAIGQNLWGPQHPGELINERGFELAVALAADTALEPEIAKAAEPAVEPGRRTEAAAPAREATGDLEMAGR